MRLLESHSNLILFEALYVIRVFYCNIIISLSPARISRLVVFWSFFSLEEELILS